MTSVPRVGIVAGGGDLPVKVFEYARRAGAEPYVLGVSGYASEEWVAKHEGELVSIGEVGRQIELLRKAGCSRLVFAGIVKRPDFSKLKVDIKGASVLPKLVAAALKGDDALLRATIEIFEQSGFSVIGADEFVQEMIGKPGLLTRRAPDGQEISDIKYAFEVVKRLGEMDIGQGAVVREGVVLAVEAQEGTDAMLDRCATLPAGGEASKGVLVKAPKPSQERRIDLPTLGIATIERASAAGLSGIAFEAGGAILLDERDMIERADELNMFLYGIETDDLH